MSAKPRVISFPRDNWMARRETRNRAVAPAECEQQDAGNGRTMRRQLSAIKARGYFEQQGRGMLLTRCLPSDESPMGHWMQQLDITGQMFGNRFLTLGELQRMEAPDDVVQLVETYNPETEAVVAIEYEPGEQHDPEIVALVTIDDIDDDETRH